MTTTHPLARAAARAHPWTDAVLAAQATGEALDAELDALDTITTCAELRSLARRIGAAAGHESAGGQDAPGVRDWERGALRRIQWRAEALFPDEAGAEWVRDLWPWRRR
jgi:hypothetical protein